MISGFIKKSIAVLIFVVLYFTIIIHFSNTILSWADAFFQANANMFMFNTTQVTYSYQPQNATTTTTAIINGTTKTLTETTTTYAIVQHSSIQTINFTPFLEFLVYIAVYFLIPIVGPILFLFGWARGR